MQSYQTAVPKKLSVTYHIDSLHVAFYICPQFVLVFGNNYDACNINREYDQYIYKSMPKSSIMGHIFSLMSPKGEKCILGISSEVYHKTRL